jgi:hypothetical protein
MIVFAAVLMVVLVSVVAFAHAVMMRVIDARVNVDINDVVESKGMAEVMVVLSVSRPVSYGTRAMSVSSVRRSKPRYSSCRLHASTGCVLS